MTRLRQIILGRRSLAGLLLALTLALKLLIPAGYMTDISSGRIAIVPCSGAGPMQVTMPGMAHHGDEHPAANKPDGTCAFAALATPGLAGADPIQLAAALVFIVAAALLAAPTRPAGRCVRLRPPSQGPPFSA